MKPPRTLSSFARLGLGVVTAACSPTDRVATRNAPPSAETSPSAPGVIDVAANSEMSLSLRGGLGPIIKGETVDKAVVTMDRVELVDEKGEVAVLSTQRVTCDLVGLQNDLEEFVAKRATRASRFKELKVRLESAWLETYDGSLTHLFASDDADATQFTALGKVGRLEIRGRDGDGFIRVALPDGGIRVEGSASVVVHFALAESLYPHGDAWTFDPRAWAVDKTSLSSLDVAFDANEESASSLSQGFKVLLLDAGLRPVSTAPLHQEKTTFTASFRYLESFDGPFVAVLLPPVGISLVHAVAVSIDVSVSVQADAHVSVTSIQDVGRKGSVVTLDVHTQDEADVVERSATGAIVDHRTRPVGGIDHVTPDTTPSEPVRPGEHALSRAPMPALPGLPLPRSHRSPPGRGGRTPPDADPPAPWADAGIASDDRTSTSEEWRQSPEHDGAAAP
jgi:hypothetical protein